MTVVTSRCVQRHREGGEFAIQNGTRRATMLMWLPNSKKISERSSACKRAGSYSFNKPPSSFKTGPAIVRPLAFASPFDL